MARQDGLIKLKGQMGGVTFYKSSEDGYLARLKGGVDGDRIRNAPEFERTRENGAEFGRAGKACKLLRDALRALVLNASDKRMVSRLTKEMMRVIKADETSLRGQRNVIDGESELLNGFDFNDNAKLTKTFFAPYTSAIDRAAGNLAISIPAFVPGNMIVVPDGATHCRLVSAGVEVDFANSAYVITTSQSADIVISPLIQPAIALSNAVTAASVHPLFLVLGIEFYQQVNAHCTQLRTELTTPLPLSV